MDEEVPRRMRDDVVVVNGAVLVLRLRPRQHVLADDLAGLGVVEPGRLHLLGLDEPAAERGPGRLAARSGAAARLPPGDDYGAVPGEGRGVKAIDRRRRRRVQVHRVRRVREVEDGDAVTCASAPVDVAEDDAEVVADLDRHPFVLAEVERAQHLRRGWIRERHLDDVLAVERRTGALVPVLAGIRLQGTNPYRARVPVRTPP